MKSASKGTTVTVIAHRRKLIQQLSERLQLFGVPYDIQMASLPDEPWVKSDPSAEITIGSVQTLASRSNVRESQIVIPDEAHCTVGAEYQYVLKKINAKYLLGPTATPCRSDGSGLGPNIFTDLIEFARIEQLLARTPPLLTHVEVWSPSGIGAKRRKGLPTSIAGDPVQQWLTRANGLRTLTFCPTVAEGIAVRDMFLAEGIEAVHHNADTPNEKRNEDIKRLESGEILVLTVTPSLMGVGVDIPMVECVQTLTKNHSPIIHWQSIGRGQRTAPGKTRAVVLDHSGAVYVHGMPNRSPVWNLSTEDSIQNREQKRQNENPEEYKPNVCPSCGLVSAGSRKCPNPECGTQLKFESRKELATERENLAKLDEMNGSPVNPAWQQEWRRILYSTAHQGAMTKVASARFKAKFGVRPEAANVSPLPSKDDRNKKVGEVFPQFVRQK